VGNRTECADRLCISRCDAGSAVLRHNAGGLRVDRIGEAAEVKCLLDAAGVCSEHDATMVEQARFMIEGSSYYSPLTAVGVGGAWYYPLYDKLGTTRRLVDANQTVTDAYWYDAFGNVTASKYVPGTGRIT
jgi:hypothetical protein